ncbi:four helix bundle protein [Patescibacteria group bacterium]|nr:four helix bundle protein [Patescibacteria group bacterium]
MNDEKVFDIKKRAYIFGIEVIKITEEFSRTTASYIIQKQLIRSATSIGANLMEGNYASSKKDFRNFINYSVKSTHETTYWLQLSKDLQLASTQKLEKLIAESIEIRKILTTIILNSKKNS